MMFNCQMKRSISIFLVAIMVSLTALSILSPSALAADEFDTLRAKWRGNPVLLDQNDPDIAAALSSSNAGIDNVWSTLNTVTGRTYLWSDLSDWTKSASFSGSYSRINTLTSAYINPNTNLYGNATVLAEIKSALAWLYQNKYNPAVPYYDNWWDFEIGAPSNLTAILMMIYDQLTPAELSNYLGVVDFFAPDPTKTKKSGVESTGANRVDNASIAIASGILGKSSARIAAGRDALSQIFPYVTSGDGFYEDGSFIFHAKLAYTAGYGSVLISGLSRLLVILKGSTWEVTDPNVDHVYKWIEDSFRPIIYKGAAMDMVRGRGISRSGSNYPLGIYNTGLDHYQGRIIVLTILALADSAPPDKAALFKSWVKAWMLEDSYFTPYYKDLAAGSIASIKAFLNDPSVVPASELVRSYVFAGMDRVVHLRPGFGFGLSLSSSRIDVVENCCSENHKGQWTGQGMTYLYNNDGKQYDNNFWPTVDSTRLPGTTTDRTMENLSQNGVYNWAGGSTVNNLYSTSGMQFSALKVTGSPLEGKKSWFLFGDKMVALGAGIRNTNDQYVETIVENRMLNSSGDNTLTVNNTVKSNTVGWSESMNNVSWAHLAGNTTGSDIGYYFPGTATVHGLRESRTGAWKDINSNESTTPFTNNFLSLALGHGTNPTDASYAYAVLPNKTAADMANYASNPDITILENSADAQAVKDTSLNAVGVNFWNDMEKTIHVDGSGFIKSNKKASVTTLESTSANTLDVGVSDPTQANTGSIDIEINRSASGVLAVDPGITVTQLSPTIKMTVNVNAAIGKNFNAKFQLNAAPPTLPTITLQAASYDSMSGITHGGTVIGGVDNGDWVKFSQVDLSSGYNLFTANLGVPAQNAGQFVDVRLDSTTGPVVGTLTTQGTGSFAAMQDQSTLLTGASGVHDIYFKFRGSYGVGNFTYFKFINDVTPPVTVNNAPSGWVSHDVTLALTASDSGSGVANTYYSVDGGPQQTGTTVSIKTPGQHSVAYYSVDKAGNSEFTQTAIVKIDRTAPVSSATVISAQPTGTYVKPVTVTLNATDSESGLLNRMYSLDGGTTWQIYTSPLTLEGSNTFIQIRSTDHAGNVETAKSINLQPSIILQAESYDTMFGVSNGGTVIGNVDNGDWVAYSQVDLREGYNLFTARLGVPSGTGKTVEIRLDSKTGPLVGTLAVQSTGSFVSFTEQTTSLTGASGVHDVYVVFKGGSGVGNFDWFKFSMQ
ncbi:polysaccharide lyase family 8 super-sandwich domain-containing protein [Paenibacillus contaminans]|uniref:CBM6 domain-containing protein n=1 Tax=Paenibacillus contaminans TaxID=450362 RepID=A0A329LQ97_9BACL|nr:polysaccharide lyase family 8 super-sandwich domain-containing protein [Paenibacillus contaminans]RAV09899.1 hypothetical protein DQG23_38605 [Paenibacillus contaminans]